MATPVKKPWQHPPIRSPATGEAGKWEATQGRDIFTPIADMDAREIGNDELERWLHPRPTFRSAESKPEEEIEGVDTNLAGLRITQSWLNKTKPDESHHLHHHSNSYLSAVLYISCLPNDGINLSNRLYGSYNNIDFPIKVITPWNTQRVIINVKEGDLLIFPSWVPHWVDVNETKDKERISLAFNTFPVGEMGSYYSHLTL